MRNLWIALVLGVTALTFYSALWFKSETIEDDITARVTEALDNTGAQPVDIGVDGRHVTLTGIVHDQEVETSLLGTANDTYGALGPIDGLTYLADGGYVSATKSDAGIVLRGTVPNEDARASLLADASAATDGTVSDELTIAGPVASWQDEARFGLSQMAGMTSGTLTAAQGTYALSGSTDADPALIENATSGRDGWSTYISSPTNAAQLEATVDTLNTGIAARDAEVGALNTQVADLEAEVEGLGTQVGSLEGQLSSQNGVIASLEADIANYQGSQSDQIADFQARIASGTATIEDQSATIESLTGDLGAATVQVEDLTGQLDQKTAMLADIDVQTSANLADTDAKLSELTGQIEGLEADLEAARAGSDDQVLALRGTVQERDDQIAALSGTVQERDDQIAALSGDIDAATGVLSDRDGAIEALQGDLAAQETIKGQQIATLRGIVAQRDDQIEELTGDVTSANAQLAEREASLAALSAASSDTQNEAGAQLDALTGQVGEQAATIAALQADVGDRGAAITALQADVADRDTTIAALRAEQPSAGLAAAQCEGEASEAIADGRINFVTGSAVIQDDSVPLLERLTGIALACVSEDGLTVEIGGHTDAQGAEASNQALSEARAQAVSAFMVERGVPTSGLAAVGFGESQPVASNDTPEGRAQNRRISFDWQAR